MKNFKNDLKNLTISLGFDAVGIAPVQPKTWNEFQRWIQCGYHGDMDYLQKRLRERCSAESVLSGARSIIAAAKSYPFHSVENSVQLHHGILSQYARVRDYHKVLPHGLKQICDFIHEQTHGEHRARWCVDTAPVLERDFAQQAGFGWIGKHTNLLNRNLGNGFFLGMVATTLELEPDQPEEPHCGLCRKCIDACPTQAIVEPYVLDARRCLAYLTIENRGPIPRELRSKMGCWVFGCDVCLAVCPWNRFSSNKEHKDFPIREKLDEINLLDVLSWSEDDFLACFAGTPVMRCKRDGFLRNAAVVLGCERNPESVPVLINALHDDSPLVRGHAAWALGEIGGSQSSQALRKAEENELDEFVLDEIRYALKQWSLDNQ